MSKAAIILAAGQGTRMKSALPKVLHPIAGKPMIRHVLDTVASLAPARVVGVIAPGADLVAAAFAPHPTATQIQARRALVLQAAYAASPGRFRRPPAPPPLPARVWINQPPATIETTVTSHKNQAA